MNESNEIAAAAADEATAPATAPTIIPPTPGRVVWFYDTADASRQPQAAIVAHVWNDRVVNLAVFDTNGNAYSRTSVCLVQEGDPAPCGMHCRWMPYQVGQAKRHGGAA